MSFILLGFSQQDNVRSFSFERVDTDGTRSRFSVDADLLLLRQFDIKVQDLPLLCRQILDSQPLNSEIRKVDVTAANMRSHAEFLAASLVRRSTKRSQPRTVAAPASPMSAI
jgi:hypothetical protein